MAAVFDIEKIAEGSYASILRIILKVDPTHFSICKLMPIKPNDAKGPKYDSRTFLDDAVAEVKILSLMRDVPGFVILRENGARVLQGIIPPVLQKLLNAWEEANPNETPISCEYSEEQYWVLLEMVDAGIDLGALLENGFADGTRLHEETPGARLTPYQTWDIFWGVAEALAAGEDLTSFEHRDVHLSNICIKRKGSGCGDDKDETQMLSKTTRYTDLEVTLIDYTLSRATFGEHEVLANSMQDSGLFLQESKAENERDRENDQHQYDTYDRMRQLVLGSARHLLDKRGRAKLWKKYVPETNLLWLHHLLFVLLRDTQKQRTAHLDYTQDKLVKFLVKIRNDLDPEKMDEWVYRSAKDVVNEERAAEVERGERSLDKEFEGIRTRYSGISDGGQGSSKGYSGINDGGEGSSKDISK
jgi:serine/threonine-protein kinase haspin